jgi:spermidine/putrescine transport system substrate-binding protein
LWDTQYRGKVHVFDAYRDMMGFALLREGNDVNTSDPEQINAAGDALLEMTDAVGVKVGGATYQALAEGSAVLIGDWGGDLNYARYYLPKGTSPDVLGFYWPPGGVVGNDTMVISSQAKNPVLAHVLIDFLYDRENALENFSYEGFQPPLSGIERDEWLSRGNIPPSLSATIVEPEDFDPGKSQQLGGLRPEVEQLYQDAWAKFTAGAEA